MQVVLLHKDINLTKALLGIFVQLRGTEYTVGLWFLPLQITAFQVQLHGVLGPPARENKATVTGSRPPADLPEILPYGKSTEMEPCY